MLYLVGVALLVSIAKGQTCDEEGKTPNRNTDTSVKYCIYNFNDQLPTAMALDICQPLAITDRFGKFECDGSSMNFKRYEDASCSGDVVEEATYTHADYNITAGSGLLWDYSCTGTAAYVEVVLSGAPECNILPATIAAATGICTVSLADQVDELDDDNTYTSIYCNDDGSELQYYTASDDPCSDADYCRVASSKAGKDNCDILIEDIPLPTGPAPVYAYTKSCTASCPDNCEGESEDSSAYTHSVFYLLLALVVGYAMQ